MAGMSARVTVAIAQARPRYLELEATMARAEELIREAAARGVQLLVFGETWLTGYPLWLDHCPGAALWDHPPTKQVFARLRRASVTVPGPETARLGELARETGVVIIIGANERVDAGPGNGTLYNAILGFDQRGALALHHRKLVPTYTERLVWGPGDTRGLRAAETAVGRVGALVCWEHWMPLARQALHNSGEQLHVAMWPTVHEMHRVASRHYAFEGRCFVLAAGLLMRTDDIPAPLTRPEGDDLLLRGGSVIIAPDGSIIAGPVFDRETLLVAELDLAHIERERMTLDVTGHYARPELLDLLQAQQVAATQARERSNGGA